MKRYIFILFCLFQTTLAVAQTCCTGGVPTMGSFVFPEVNKNELGAHLLYNYNINNDLLFEEEEIENSIFTRNVHALIAQLDYGISDKWSLLLSVPYLWQTEDISNALNGSIQYTNTGIGDITFWGCYKNNLRTFNYGVALGLKMPTGSTNQRRENGILFPLRFQNGSGSWDLGLNLITSLPIAMVRKFYWDQQIIIKLNTKGANFKAHPNYVFGNEFQWMQSLSYQFILSRYIVKAYSGALFQYRKQDTFDSDLANENTGGLWFNGMVGVVWHWNTQLSIAINGMMPLYRKLNGLQLSTTSHWTTSINYLFSKKR